MKSTPLAAGIAAVVTILATASLTGTAAAATDTTPPPTPGGFTLVQRYGTTAQFTWNWTMDNGGYVPAYELTYGNKTVAINHSYPGHSQNISDLNLGPGNAYTFKLRAVDQAGNRSAVAAQLVLETNAPGQASNLQVLSTRQGYPDTIGLTTAPDDSGLIRDYEVVLNGESLGTVGRGATQFSLFEQVFNIACIDPPSGPATLQLRAIDGSFNGGALSAPQTVIFP